MTHSVDEQEWYRVLMIARINAANDLKISNEILEVVDQLVEATNKRELTDQKVSEFSKSLINSAIELSDLSKKMSVAISKLVGTI